jgi:hypothetical protein
MRVLEGLENLVFFTGNPTKEDEANWLAGAILLPSLCGAESSAGMHAEALANRYQTSQTMARFSLNATGVNIQADRRRRYVRS